MVTVFTSLSISRSNGISGCLWLSTSLSIYLSVCLFFVYLLLTLLVSVIYPSHSPLLGLQLYLLGKMEWFPDSLSLSSSLSCAWFPRLAMQTDAALCAFQQAYDTLCVTHGKSHSLTQQLVSQIQEAQAEQAYKSAQRKPLM